MRSRSRAGGLGEETAGVPERSRVWRATGPGAIRLDERPTPEPGDGELLVGISVALTCGTDLKLVQRGHPKIRFPTPLGHEWAGRVIAAGPGVRGIAEGARVTALPTAPCGDCAYCVRRLENLCVHLFEVSAFGAFGDTLLIPRHIVARHTFQIPDSVSDVAAAFLEPLACVVHGASLLSLSGDRTLALVGDGPIALLFLQVARLAGVDRVALVGRHAKRLAAARALGAEPVVDAGRASSEDVVREWADGVGADSVVECVGRPDAWVQALSLARRGGEVLFFGGCEPGSAVALDTARIHYDELTLRGGFHYTPASARRAFGLITGGALRLEPLVSDTVPLEALPDAFERVRRREVLKLAVRP